MNKDGSKKAGDIFSDDIIDSTSSQHKIWTYLSSLETDSEFREKIVKIRELHKIPKNGFKEVLHKKSGFSKDEEYISPPDGIETLELSEEVGILLKNIGLTSIWDDTLKYYIIYNQWFKFYSFGGLIQVEDVNNSLNGEFQYDGERDAMESYIRGIAKDYPVALFISPYSSQRDIIDYVKKTYVTHIKPLQDSYKEDGVKIGNYYGRV